MAKSKMMFFSKTRLLPLTISFLAALHFKTSDASYSIDDGILFRLNFQPSEATATPPASPNAETSAVPSDESLLGNKVEEPLLKALDNSDDYETILMTTSRNEQYHCTLPKEDLKASLTKEAYTGPNALSILEKLFVSQACAYRLEHYWTYELCHGRFLRQFHEERDGKKIKVTEYFLGRYTKEQFTQESVALKASIEQGTVRKPPKKKIETMNLPFYELDMVDGTVCDLTGLPRTTRVHYVCYPNGKHEIYSFRESSTCEYEVIVLSNIICNHPDYRPEESNEQVINCQPANDKTSRKPFDLISMETEALKFRSNKMFEAQMFQGDKGPGSVKIEIKPFNPEGTPLNVKNDAKDDNDDDEEQKYHDENWKEKLRREPFKPLMDPEVVKEFLLGEYCLHGGTGWWKYEFCYGKTVDQYHEEKNGHRTVINLGRFDRAKHLEWVDKNPAKKPKARELRKHVSHFYSGGDVCDVTGKHRQVEVKLKCKPSDSPSAVSLYLLEPKTCEYILGIESPLVCDILPLADDQYGLMEVTEDQFQHQKSSEDAEPSSTGESGKFVEPEILKFTEEDAVKSPYGDPKNVPFADDNIIIITDYQTAEDDDVVAADYDDYENDQKEDFKTKVP